MTTCSSNSLPPPWTSVSAAHKDILQCRTTNSYDCSRSLVRLMALHGMILEQKQRAQQLMEMPESRNVRMPFRHPRLFSLGFLLLFLLLFFLYYGRYTKDLRQRSKTESHQPISNISATRVGISGRLSSSELPVCADQGQGMHK